MGGGASSSWPTARTSRGGYTRDRGDPAKERPTLEGKAEAWRTPSDISKRGGSQPAEKRLAGGHSVNLEDQAEYWATPNVPNGGRTANHVEMKGRTALRLDGSKVQIGLEHQAKAWPTPCARDWFPPHSPEYVAEKKAQGHGMRNLSDESVNWPTPQVGNRKSARAMAASRDNGRRSGGGQSSPPGLEQLAEIFHGAMPEEMVGLDLPETTRALIASTWPTPMTRDHRSGSAIKSDVELWGKKGRPLERVALMWPTPAAGEVQLGYQRRPEGMASRQNQQSLTTIAVDFRLSHPALPIPPGAGSPPPILSSYRRMRLTTDSVLRSEHRALIRMGIRSRGQGPTNKGWTRRTPAHFVRPSFRRRLNPTFVELLMRWPIGWTDFACSATGLTLWLRHMRSCVLTLDTAPIAARQSELAL